MTSKVGITACILAKNEEKVISNCLKSIVNYVDEIILVDNGSNDKTVEIAKDFGSKIINAESFTFDSARNLYIEAASYPWIFVIDADEVITPEGGLELRKLVREVSDNIMAFYLPHLNYFGEGKWANFLMCRLFRKHPQIKYNDRPIHASVVPSIKALNGAFARGSVLLHHFDLLYCEEKSLSKRFRNINLLESEIAKNPQDHNLHYYLGLEYWALDRLDEAEREFKLAISLDHNRSPLAQFFLAQLYLSMNEIEKSETIVENLLSFDIGIKDKIYTLLAEISLKRQELDKALSFTKEALLYDPMSPNLNLNFASLLERFDPISAIRHLQIALKYNPFLLNSIIYKEIKVANIYKIQKSGTFLSSTKTIFNHMINCWERIGDYEKAQEWRKKKINITYAT